MVKSKQKQKYNSQKEYVKLDMSKVYDEQSNIVGTMCTFGRKEDLKGFTINV
jgi:hypothetical protein